MKDASEIWNAALPLIKDKVTEVGYSTVFPMVSAKGIDGNTFYLKTSNSLYKDIFNVYSDKVRQSLLELTNIPYELEVIIETDGEPAVVETAPQSSFDNSSFPTFNSRFTFENFIVGKNSEFAYAAAYAVALGPVKPERNPFFIYGGSGLGKTHLLHAVANEVKKNHPEKNILCLTAEQFCNLFIESIRYKTQIEFHNKFRNVDMLLIDDIQFFAKKEGMQEEFFHTFEALVGANKQIMLTCDRPAKDIVPLEERLRTRLAGGLTTDIQPPDFETRVAILHSKIENSGNVEVSDEILSLIAQTIKSNIRELEGAIRTILAWQEIQKKEIDVDTAKKIVDDYFTTSHRRKIDAELIIKEVQKHFGLGENTIVSKKRDKAFSYPRQVAMTICRELTGLSYTEIGKEFDRTHSTVMHNITEIRDEMEKNLDTYNMIQDLIKNIQNYNE